MFPVSELLPRGADSSRGQAERGVSTHCRVLLSTLRQTAAASQHRTLEHIMCTCNPRIRTLSNVFIILFLLLTDYYYYYYYFFKPSVSIPEGGLKIDENKLKGYDAQSVQSGTGKLSCSRTALKRCTSTESR